MKRNELIYSEINDELPQQRPLSLSDISPTWAKRLQGKQPLLPFLISLTRLRWLSEITNPRKCVVGEAYGFSASYTDSCSQCASIGNKFSLYFAMCSHKKLENTSKSIRSYIPALKFDRANTASLKVSTANPLSSKPTFKE